MRRHSAAKHQAAGPPIIACEHCSAVLCVYTLACCRQGFVLGQYGLLYALEHEDQVERLFILNTPLALNSKLRPELAAYKSPLPFLRPGNVSCVLELHHGRLTHKHGCALIRAAGCMRTVPATGLQACLAMAAGSRLCCASDAAPPLLRCIPMSPPPPPHALMLNRSPLMAPLTPAWGAPTRCWSLTVWCMMHPTRCVLQLLGCFQGAAALWCGVCDGRLHSCSRSLQLPSLPKITDNTCGRL